MDYYNTLPFTFPVSNKYFAYRFVIVVIRQKDMAKLPTYLLEHFPHFLQTTLQHSQCTHLY